jgi:hypothetical protein
MLSAAVLWWLTGIPFGWVQSSQPQTANDQQDRPILIQRQANSEVILGEVESNRLVRAQGDHG